MTSLPTGKAGVLVAPDDAHDLDKIATAILDDLLYNIIHDLCVNVHRNEKTARAQTAAIQVEKLASDSTDVLTIDARPDIRIETNAAIYDSGKVTLKENPLQTVHEIYCPRCRLPRLLYPTDGKGACKPDPSVIYCKRHPYIDKEGYDIYGQKWIPQGPGRGKKKKDADKKGGGGEGTPGPENMSTAAKDRPPNVLSYPSATCSKCKRCILINRLNNHMGTCIGNCGRNASRAAAQKLGHSTNGGLVVDNTPPSSQKGTPLPASRAASPRKRDGDEFDQDAAGDAHETSPPAANAAKRKKLNKGSGAVVALNHASTPTPTTTTTTTSSGNKKAIIKMNKGAKKDKTAKGSSFLSIEHKVDGGDHHVTSSAAVVEVAAPAPKKPGPKVGSTKKKLRLAQKKPPLSSAMAKHERDGDFDGGESVTTTGTLSSPR